MREVSVRKTSLKDIRIKISASNFIYIQIFYLMIVFFLRDVFGMPSAITYVTDVIMVLAFLCCLRRIQRTMNLAQARIQLYIIIAILLFMCL